MGETFDSLDMPSASSYTECMEMLEYGNTSQLTDILKVCSKALAQLNSVSKDIYSISTEKTEIIRRIGINFLSNLIIDDIIEFTQNLTFTDDQFGYIRDEFIISDHNAHFDYFVQAVNPWHQKVYHTDSYNATILTLWAIYNLKTNQLLKTYVLEERQTKKEIIYLFETLDEETNFIPSHIYGINLPMDIYYSTKLVLIHQLNGKGKLAKYEVSDTDYIMILINENEAAKVMADKQNDL